jgi:hypothetical protein
MAARDLRLPPHEEVNRISKADGFGARGTRLLRMREGGSDGAIECGLKQCGDRRPVFGRLDEVAVERVDGKMVLGFERAGEPRGEVLTEGGKEIGGIVGDIDEDGDGEGVVAFETEGDGMKRATGVERNVDPLRIEWGREAASGKNDGGDLDEAGVEVEGVGGGVVICGLGGFLRAQRASAAEGNEQKKGEQEGVATGGVCAGCSTRNGSAKMHWGKYDRSRGWNE